MRTEDRNQKEAEMSEHYILDGKEVKPAGLMEWAKWFEIANRHIAKTKINDDVKVSTVFLGLDHSFGDGHPLLFETMIFGGEHDQYQERFETWEQAETGHQVAVASIKS